MISRPFSSTRSATFITVPSGRVTGITPVSGLRLPASPNTSRMASTSSYFSLVDSPELTLGI